MELWPADCGNLFLHRSDGPISQPLDALHGDLGVVAADDVCVLVSNSGETTELLELIPHLNLRGTARIALVGRAESSLALDSDVVLEASVDREVCPLNLAPTASTAVAMAIGDALAAVWMERQGISPSDFALNHPAGSLGKQLTMTVRQLMVPRAKLPVLHRNTSLPDVICNLTNNSIGSGWVADPNQPERLVGLITDGDLRRALLSHNNEEWASLRACDLMTTDPITTTPEALAIEAIKQWNKTQERPSPSCQ